MARLPYSGFERHALKHCNSTLKACHCHSVLTKFGGFKLCLHHSLYHVDLLLQQKIQKCSLDLVLLVLKMATTLGLQYYVNNCIYFTQEFLLCNVTS